MSKRKIGIALLLVALLVFAGVAQAQDDDGDGVPNRTDNCPNQAGPRTNQGCPLPQPEEESGPVHDKDGDGVLDFADQCPDNAGTGFSNGCPLDMPPITLPDQGGGPTLLMIWESTDVCMVGVPLNAASNVNVRKEPTTNSNVIGQLVPGQQWSPWFRDYDENNQVWFAGAPTPNDYGWVADSAVIDNGQCVNLPMVIHVDAPQEPKFEVSFDPDTVPQEFPNDFNWWPPGENAASDFLLIIDGIPGESESQPTPTPVPGINLQIFTLGLDDVLLNFTNEGGSNTPTDQLIIIIGHRMGGEGACVPVPGGSCMDAVLLLPAVGDPTGMCSADSFVKGLQAMNGAWGGFDPDAGGLNFANLDDTSLIGLLLPAVQKVREAAAMGDGSVVPGENLSLNFTMPGEDLLLNFAMPGDDLMLNFAMPNTACPLVFLTPQMDGGITDGSSVGFDAFVMLMPTDQMPTDQ